MIWLTQRTLYNRAASRSYELDENTRASQPKRHPNNRNYDQDLERRLRIRTAQHQLKHCAQRLSTIIYLALPHPTGNATKLVICLRCACPPTLLAYPSECAHKYRRLVQLALRGGLWPPAHQDTSQSCVRTKARKVPRTTREHFL